MLILLGAALFAFGLLLFGVGVTVYLIGLILRVAIRLFQLVLLLVWAGVAVCSWLRQRRKVTVLEGEILPPERRALPDRSHVRRLLLAGVMVLAASMAHADDWQQRAKEAVQANDVDTADADREGFWVGHNYYWPDRDYYYNKWRRAYFSLGAGPTMRDAPSWLRYPPKPPWRVIGRSRRR
jgi:hypothetical protein